jgi:hypothetical protein
MKTRTGFVSNSSSSSFVINPNELTKAEKNAIVNYINNPDDNEDGWWIYRDDEFSFNGSTNMDNGSIDEFLASIGIDLNRFSWSD